MGRVLAASVGLSLLCAPQRGAAQQDDGSIALAWNAPPECPTQRDVLEEIHRRLGGTPAPGRSRLRASGTVQREGDGRYRVHLTTDVGGVGGDKELDDASCSALTDAAALVLALTFDPEAVAAASASPRPPGQAAPVPAISLPSSRLAAPDRSAATAEPGWHVGAHLAADGALGVLPGVALGLGAGASLLVSRLRAELGFAWFPTRTGQLQNHSGPGGGDFKLVAGSAAGCFAALRAPVELGPCLGLDAGVMSAEGRDAPRKGSGTGVWLAPFAMGLAVAPLTDVIGLRAEVGAEVPIFRNHFVLENLGVVHRAAPVAGRAALGAEVRF